MPTLFLMTQERAKELQLRNEMRDEIAKKDQLLAQLQSREKDLQEALCRAQENEAASKHDLALLAKEKVHIIKEYKQGAAGNDNWNGMRCNSATTLSARPIYTL